MLATIAIFVKDVGVVVNWKGALIAPLLTALCCQVKQFYRLRQHAAASKPSFLCSITFNLVGYMASCAKL